MAVSKETKPKGNSMSVTTEAAATKVAVDPSQSKATTSETRIHWAAAANGPEALVGKLGTETKIDPAQVRRQALEEKFEAMRVRNWITERMVEQYQKHWQCSREAALERLLSKTGA